MKPTNSQIVILGDAEKDRNNGAARVAYRCSCGYEGTTRKCRAATLLWCKGCNQKYSRLRHNDFKVAGHTALIDVSTAKFPEAVCKIDLADLALALDGAGRWFASDFGSEVVYVVRGSRNQKLHRLLMSPTRSQVVDHINGDGLDNRRANLRACQQADNAKNRVLSPSSKSGFLGVVLAPNPNKWIAQGSSGGERFHLGTFPSIQEAAQARKAFEAAHGFSPTHGRQRNER